MGNENSKILFVTEGNPVALLQTKNGRKRSVDPKKIASPQAGLEWCRKNEVVMLYTPALKFRQN